MSMVKEKVLDRNILSMRLREPRELIFGAVNHDRFTEKLVQIPLTNKTGRYTLEGRWQTKSDYLTLGSEPGVRMSLAGYTTSFSTMSAYIILPYPDAKDIWEDLLFEEIILMPPSVACEQRRVMPDITFNLAGKNSNSHPIRIHYAVAHGAW